ncbi:hypothetical protein BD289DRAFT_444388 [Coniella lustricola]|uniref:Uncharacterized protein n=1 Tax=Coniella lustricola TaxID=2025994 RepID=A0A2T2ZVY4_9PEZI|nr:hypothetical protein BD289DRAFT_444388 [Coniella lustricola]
MRRSAYATMNHFTTDLQYVRVRLYKLGKDIDDQILMSIVIHKIRETLEHLCFLLFKEWEDGTLIRHSMIFQIDCAKKFEKMLEPAGPAAPESPSRSNTTTNGENTFHPVCGSCWSQGCPEHVLDKLIWCTECNFVGLTYSFHHCDLCRLCHFPGQHKKTTKVMLGLPESSSSRSYYTLLATSPGLDDSRQGFQLMMQGCCYKTQSFGPTSAVNYSEPVEWGLSLRVNYRIWIRP